MYLRHNTVHTEQHTCCARGTVLRAAINCLRCKSDKILCFVSTKKASLSIVHQTYTKGTLCKLHSIGSKYRNIIHHAYCTILSQEVLFCSQSLKVPSYNLTSSSLLPPFNAKMGMKQDSIGLQCEDNSSLHLSKTWSTYRHMNTQMFVEGYDWALCTFMCL